MKEHKSNSPIIVHVLSGEIESRMKETAHILNQGDIISLNTDIMHELKSHQDSVIRLSISSTNIK